MTRSLICGVALLAATSGMAFAQIKSANEVLQGARSYNPPSITTVTPSPRGYSIQSSDGSVGTATRMPNGGYSITTYGTR
jgi:hypothetical protein